MPTAEELIVTALRQLPDKPGDASKQAVKKAYSERMSNVVALAMAQALRDRGLAEARPAEPGVLDQSGAERRMAGGIGAKKVDVTWATAESGLLLAISIKTINFRDTRSGNFQKNLTNRRGDMLIEAVTLHRRFPYSVLMGMLLLDSGAENDSTDRRVSTFGNAHELLRMFDGRDDPAGRDEQYERFYVGLLNTDATRPPRMFRVGNLSTEVSLTALLDELVKLVALRNPDLYVVRNGRLFKRSGLRG